MYGHQQEITECDASVPVESERRGRQKISSTFQSTCARAQNATRTVEAVEIERERQQPLMMSPSIYDVEIGPDFRHMHEWKTNMLMNP